MRRADQLLTCGMLLKDVWDYKFVPVTTNLVDVHIGHLRQKLDGAGEMPLLNTVRGAGFILPNTSLNVSWQPKLVVDWCPGSVAVWHN